MEKERNRRKECVRIPEQFRHNLAGIVSNAIRIFYVEIFLKIFNFTSLAVLKESLSPLKTSDPLTSSLIFIMVG